MTSIVVKDTDSLLCGVILHLRNIFVNSQNHQQGFVDETRLTHESPEELSHEAIEAMLDQHLPEPLKTGLESIWQQHDPQKIWVHQDLARSLHQILQ